MIRAFALLLAALTGLAFLAGCGEETQQADAMKSQKKAVEEGKKLGNDQVSY